MTDKGEYLHHLRIDEVLITELYEYGSVVALALVGTCIQYMYIRESAWINE